MISIIPDFLDFWSKAEHMNEREQVELFRQQIISAHQDLFATDIVGLDGRLVADDIKIATFLKGVRPLIPTIRSLGASLTTTLATLTSNFQTAFPDYIPSTPIYFTISMGHFDGGTRTVGGQSALLFGVDVIAKLYGPRANLSVLLDHELFHQYHLPYVPAQYNNQLWWSLWEEGLATYVSWRMNPASSEGDVLLNAELPAQAGPMQRALAKELLSNLSSIEPTEYARFFTGGGPPGEFPKRSGYFIGFRIVQIVGQSHTLKDLAQMNGIMLKDAIQDALEILARPDPKLT